MAASSKSQSQRRRTAPKEERRRQLIEATLDSIAKNGFADTTLSAVSKQAGLSQGIVNLHFTNKETLLVETLKYISDDYKTAWEEALEKSGSDPAEKIASLVKADFSKRVCDQRKLAVWFAFWGEAKSRPTYLKICKERDDAYVDMLGDLCKELARGEGVVDPNRVAEGLDAMIEGLWLELLMGYTEMTRERALSIAMDYLAMSFPNHRSNFLI